MILCFAANLTGLYIAIGVVGLFFIGLFAIYLHTFYSPHKKQDNPMYFPEEINFASYKETITQMITSVSAIPYETVSIKSDDGLTLYGKYYHQGDGLPLEILVHGYRGTPVRDFSGGIPDAMESGYNVLAIEHRAHGRSQGHTLTFGIKEKYDVLRWVDYAVERFGKDVKIVLVGISMGAATVLMASELPMPSNVKGVFADCPYSSPKAIVKSVISNMKLPANLVYPFVWLSARIFGGFDLSKGSAVEAVKNTKLPICIIHGGGDNFVPWQMSVEIAEANKDIRLCIVPNATHAFSYIVDKQTYLQEADNFRAKIFADNQD